MQSAWEYSPSGRIWLLAGTASFSGIGGLGSVRTVSPGARFPRRVHFHLELVDVGGFHLVWVELGTDLTAGYRRARRHAPAATRPVDLEPSNNRDRPAACRGFVLYGYRVQVSHAGDFPQAKGHRQGEFHTGPYL